MIADRVRCTEWVHKLVMLSDDSLENIKIRNDYAQYLRIMLRAGVLHGIFSDNPPTTLMPFPEAMVNTRLKFQLEFNQTSLKTQSDSRS